MTVDDEAHERHAFGNAIAHGLHALRGNVLGRVHAAGKDDAVHAGGCGRDVLHCTLSCLEAGLVAVKQADDATARQALPCRREIARQHLDLLRGKRRAQRGDAVRDARLVGGDDVGVALHDDGLEVGGDGRLGPLEGEKVRLLVEDRRVGRVEVLGLGVVEDTAAKTHGSAALVADEEHHAVVEAIGKRAVVATNGQVGVDHLARRKSKRRQMARQGPHARRIPQRPVLRDRRAEAAMPEIVARSGRGRSARAGELGVIELSRRLHDLIQAALLRRVGVALIARSVIGQHDACAVGQDAHGLGKLDVVALHHEVEAVAALAAAKALPEAPVRHHMKRRGLLVMEGAAAPHVMAALTQGHRFADKLHEVGRLAHLLLLFGSEHAKS